MQGIYIEKIIELSFCEECLTGKMCQKPFPTVEEIRSTNYSCCIMMCAVQYKHNWLEEQGILSRLLMITVGAALHTSWNTNQVLDKFKEYEVTTTNSAGSWEIGTLRTDNEGEYLSSAFQNYLKEEGIRYELTVPHSPQTEWCIRSIESNFGWVSTLDDRACRIIRRTFFGPKLSLKLRMWGIAFPQRP